MVPGRIWGGDHDRAGNNVRLGSKVFRVADLCVKVGCGAKEFSSRGRRFYGGGGGGGGTWTVTSFATGILYYQKHKPRCQRGTNRSKE